MGRPMIGPRPGAGAGPELGRGLGDGPRRPPAASAVVVAVVAPGDLDAVLDALDRQGAGAVHVSEAQGRPAPGAHPTETYKGAVYRIRLAPRVRLEVVVPVADAPALMEAISAAAREPPGEGDLFAVDLLARRVAAPPDGPALRPSVAGACEGDDPPG